jgi:hypothetical protein
LHISQENPAFVRPAVTAGTGVAIDCTLAIHARAMKAPY